MINYDKTNDRSRSKIPLLMISICFSFLFFFSIGLQGKSFAYPEVTPIVLNGEPAFVISGSSSSLIVLRGGHNVSVVNIFPNDSGNRNVTTYNILYDSLSRIVSFDQDITYETSNNTYRFSVESIQYNNQMYPDGPCYTDYGIYPICYQVKNKDNGEIWTISNQYNNSIGQVYTYTLNFQSYEIKVGSIKRNTQGGTTGYTAIINNTTETYGSPDPKGELKITINPEDARLKGAQYKMELCPTAWRDSGTTTVNLPMSDQTVCYKEITGWSTPPCEVIAVVENHTAEITRSYTALTNSGSLQVTISPQGAIDAGAQWRRVGTDVWQNSGIMETGVPVGSRIIEFKDVSGWERPDNQNVIIVNGQTTNISDIYLANQYVLAPSAGEGGTISPETTQMVNRKSITTFEITPNANYHTADVLVDGISVGPVWRYTFKNVTANHTIRATFTINTYTLTIRKVGTGSGIVTSTPFGINCGTQCSAYFNSGTQVNLTAQAASGSTFAGWWNTATWCGDLENCSLISNYDREVTASFASPLGDVNNDDQIDLTDAILSLQILSRIDMTGRTITMTADVNNDGKIGTQELIYILEKVASLR